MLSQAIQFKDTRKKVLGGFAGPVLSLQMAVTHVNISIVLSSYHSKYCLTIIIKAFPTVHFKGRFNKSRGYGAERSLKVIELSF